MLLKKTPANTTLSRSIIASVGLHVLLVGGLVYASTLTNKPILLEQDAAMNVVMINPAMFAAPQEANSDENQQAAQEESVAVEPVVEQPIVEQPIVEQPIPEPVIEEPIVEPEPAPVVKPEVQPVVKPKPLPPKPKPKPQQQKPKPEVKQKVISEATETKVSSTVTTNNAATSTAAASNLGTSNTGNAKALKQFKPPYPDRARSMNVEGEVKVRFDVDNSGRVTNVRILSETPPNIFTREVKRTMNRWRYETNKSTANMEITIQFRIKGGASIT